jgi:hypothetical protein
MNKTIEKTLMPKPEQRPPATRMNIQYSTRNDQFSDTDSDVSMSSLNIENSLLNIDN